MSGSPSARRAWWRAASIYQVYPRSFADSNGDGIGDLPGIVGHLDHLVDLGVDAVWVSPFFRSPQRDIGYDISDFRTVAPEYGDLDDVRRLVDGAHERGLRVLFDLVLNHTSDEHPWFVESRSSRSNERADWYVWADGRRDRRGRPAPPNNWRSELQLTRAWQWAPEREQWYLATFLPFQPDLNWRHPEVRAEMFDTIRGWLDLGVDGFRLDIFGSIMQDPLLRDNDPRPDLSMGLPRIQRPTRTLNTDDNVVLAADLRAVCDEYSPAHGTAETPGSGQRILLGEVFGPADVLRRYVRDGAPGRERDGLHLVFLFDFLAARYDAGRYRELIERFEAEFPAPLQPTYVLENHDRTRSLSRLGGDLAKARVLATLLCTLRGVIVLYQGQEIGMTNRYIPLAEADDPIPGLIARRLPEAVNRRLPERLNRDEVRTPMQWTSAPNAGFCPDDVTPWLPVDDHHVDRNVADQSDDPSSLLSLYRDLLALRRSSAALTDGTLRLLSAGAPGIVAYERVAGDPATGDAATGDAATGERLVVVAHLGDRDAEFTLDEPGVASVAIVLATDPGVTVRVAGAGRWSVRLPANTAVVLRCRPGGG